jgi:DNA helicase-2/ATP-dependent DNA helicase PcrA
MYLTDEQKRAIEAPLSNNMFILACAGSGKTTVMAKRIVYLLKNSNVSPEAIVSFTFTEKAAKELKNRVYLYAREELGENFNGLANMYVGTVHAYCLKLLHENIVKYSRYSVLDEIKQRIFISKHHKILIAPLKERIKQDITVRNYTNVIGNLNENFLSIEKVDQE